MGIGKGRKLGKLAVFAYGEMTRREKPKEKKPLMENLFGKPAYMAWEMRKKK